MRYPYRTGARAQAPPPAPTTEPTPHHANGQPRAPTGPATFGGRVADANTVAPRRSARYATEPCPMRPFSLRIRNRTAPASPTAAPPSFRGQKPAWRRPLAFVALFALAAIAAAVALTLLLPPTAGRTASAQDTLDECHDLTLEMYFREGNRDNSVYRVSNRADETLTNVNVEIKLRTPKADGTSAPTPPLFHLIDDDIKFITQNYPFYHYTDRNGSLWREKTDPNDSRTWKIRWLMPHIRPAGSHSVYVAATNGLGNNNVSIMRHTVTMTQLTPDGKDLCKTERVYWTRAYGASLGILKTAYGVALSVDEQRPAAGDTVNFKSGRMSSMVTG